ncbi:hypothetical protein [Actinocrispum wychmicini]|uniref:Uncharacterized protein n=1 Tax=Actinocrispum wychmicini TaxID=1213861 RepID=A0A4R2JBL5_9PSEU|nr:hypothetical protein [Actinocrispum wychmicini]TCO56881.1 hypothetical protein EV192_106356 [Actinocrispum wychmicini]
MYEVEVIFHRGEKMHHINAQVDEFADVVVIRPDTATRVVIPLTSISYYVTTEVQ